MFEKLLSAIAVEQAELSRRSMLAPARDLFEHGVAVGRYQGLEQCKELIARLLEEADEKEREFERRF